MGILEIFQYHQKRVLSVYHILANCFVVTRSWKVVLFGIFMAFLLLPLKNAICLDMLSGPWLSLGPLK